VRGHANGRRGGSSGHAGDGVIRAGFIRAGAAGPRCGDRPGWRSRQQPFQHEAGEGFPVDAVAFVEVSGEVGDDVQVGYLRGRG
jgi:hypothetical protein